MKNKKLLRKSLTQIDKELDLKKFLHRSRVTFASLLGLLTSKQSAFVDRMSRVAIRESTDLDVTTDDDELESKQFEKDMNLFVQRMVKSTDQIDQRFINLYRVRKAHENKVRIGFKGLDFVKKMPLERDLEPIFEEKVEPFDISDYNTPTHPSMNTGLQQQS